MPHSVRKERCTEKNKKEKRTFLFACWESEVKLRILWRGITALWTEKGCVRAQNCIFTGETVPLWDCCILFHCVVCTMIDASWIDFSSSNSLLFVTGMGPQYLTFSRIYVPSRQLCSLSDTCLFQIPSVKVNWPMYFCIPRSCSLEQPSRNVRHASSIKSFKTAIKTELFQQWDIYVIFYSRDLGWEAESINSTMCVCLYRCKCWCCVFMCMCAQAQVVFF